MQTVHDIALFCVAPLRRVPSIAFVFLLVANAILHKFTPEYRWLNLSSHAACPRRATHTNPRSLFFQFSR